MNIPAALDAPIGDVITISEELVQRALVASRESPRKRVILPFHKTHEALLHRMLNAMQPGTYLQPHRHDEPPKEEVFLVLRGAIDLVVFDDEGAISDVVALSAESDAFGVDLAAGRYHSFLVREPDTILYEVKLGPFTPASAKSFASWAPEENTAGVSAYVEALESAIDAWRNRP
jgi:cupin fold WbuC family metalloprotein